MTDDWGRSTKPPEGKVERMALDAALAIIEEFDEEDEGDSFVARKFKRQALKAWVRINEIADDHLNDPIDRDHILATAIFIRAVGTDEDMPPYCNAGHAVLLGGKIFAFLFAQVDRSMSIGFAFDHLDDEPIGNSAKQARETLRWFDSEEADRKAQQEQYREAQQALLAAKP